MPGVNTPNLQLGVDPRTKLGHAGVHSGNVHLAASDAPGNNAGGLEAVLLASNWTHQWGATITLAGVLVLLTAGANEAVVQNEMPAESSFAQIRLALLLGHHGHVDLLQDNLIFPILAELVLAPAGGIAAIEIEFITHIGQANGLNVLLEGEWTFQQHDSHIVIERSLVELLMVDYFLDISVFVPSDLSLRLRIPFASSH